MFLNIRVEYYYLNAPVLIAELQLWNYQLFRPYYDVASLVIKLRLKLIMITEDAKSL